MLLFCHLFSGYFAFPVFLVLCVLDCQFSLVVPSYDSSSFLFVYHMWFCFDYLFSGYLEVLAKNLVYEIVHYLIASYFLILVQFSHFPLPLLSSSCYTLFYLVLWLCVYSDEVKFIFGEFLPLIFEFSI